jgi:hypothetical protein
MPERIQRKRTKGWTMPDGAVYVGRPTKWGNPFGYRTYTGLARVPAVHDPDAEWEYEGRISADGARHDYHHPDGTVTVCHVRYMTRAEIVETFRLALLGLDTPAMQRSFPNGRGKWLGRWVGKHPDVKREYTTVEDVRRELAGKDLACWCKLTDPCHADVLLAIAAGQEV